MLNLKGPRRQPGGLLLCTFPGINCPLGIYSSYFIILFSGLGKISLSLFRHLWHCTDPVNLGGNILLSLIAKPPQNCWAQKRSYCNLVWHDLPTVGSMAACLPGLWPQGDLGIWSSCHTPEAASWFQYQPSSWIQSLVYALTPIQMGSLSERQLILPLFKLNYTGFLSFPLYFKSFLYNTSHKVFPRNSFNIFLPFDCHGIF